MRSPITATRLAGLIVLLIGVGYCGYMTWVNLPAWRYRLVGAPAPGTAPRHIGTVEVEGESKYRGRMEIPPRYFIVTEHGRVEFHCGFRPVPRTCWFVSYQRPRTDEVFEIGYDEYWGVDYVKLPRRGMKQAVWTAFDVDAARAWQSRSAGSSLLIMLSFTLAYLWLVARFFVRDD